MRDMWKWCRKFFISEYAGWQINPEFDLKHLNPEEKELIIFHSTCLFKAIQKGQKMLMIGSSTKCLETFVQAIELGMKGSFIWIMYDGILPDLTHLPPWIQESTYFRGPFQMNVELLVCTAYTIILTNKCEKFQWENCAVTDCIDIHKYKRLQQEPRRIIVVPASTLQKQNNKIFDKEDGWIICAPSFQNHKTDTIQHWRSVLEVLHVTYGQYLYHFYSIQVPSRKTTILFNIYSACVMIPYFICLHYQYDWGIFIFSLGFYYMFLYHYFTAAWLAYSPQGVTRVHNRGEIYRQLCAIGFNLIFIIYSCIPIYIGTQEYRISYMSCAPLCFPFFGCVLLLCVHQNGCFSSIKVKWTLGFLGLPLLFFLFPPFIIISILLEQISPTLSGIYIAFIFVFIEYGSVYCWSKLFKKLVTYSHECSMTQVDSLTSFKVNQKITGDQKKAMVITIVLIRIWCETARLCTTCCILILSSWNDGVVGEENHMLYISGSISSLIISFLGRTGYFSDFVLKILIQKFSKQKTLLQKYWMPNLWTWVHRDCSFYFGYPRFIVIGSIFIARGCVLQTGFQLYTGTVHSFCWTPGVLYCCLLNLVLECIEDILVFRQSRVSRHLMSERGSTLRSLENKSTSNKNRRSIMENKNTVYQSQFDCTLQTYSLSESTISVTSNIGLVLFLFIVFIGRASFIGRGPVQTPDKHLVNNLTDLILWKLY